jgi:hypothetical protein
MISNCRRLARSGANMTRPLTLRASASAIALVMVSGCGLPSPVMAPGAEDVKITRNPADVAGCTPAGNIDYESMTNLYATQNKAVGYNANVVLNTVSGGIAYRCEKVPTTTQ